jgi:ADP-ribose pyrophosphatase
MYTYKYPHPAVTADCIVFAGQGTDLQVLLIERRHAPCQGCWAFPGGFMNINETADDAARRELREETGLDVSEVVQVGAFTQIDRDPRERVITIAYYTLLPNTTEVSGADDALQARWFSLAALPPLAFDHAEILQQALKLLKTHHAI